VLTGTNGAQLLMEVPTNGPSMSDFHRWMRATKGLHVVMVADEATSRGKGTVYDLFQCHEPPSKGPGQSDERRGRRPALRRRDRRRAAPDRRVGPSARWACVNGHLDLLAGGHEFSAGMAMGSPRGWPRDSSRMCRTPIPRSCQPGERRSRAGPAARPRTSDVRWVSVSMACPRLA
jgi:hypothetical protein